MSFFGYSYLNPVFLALFGIVSLSLCSLGVILLIRFIQNIYHYDYLSALKSNQKDYGKIEADKYRKELMKDYKL